MRNLFLGIAAFSFSLPGWTQMSDINVRLVWRAPLPITTDVPSTKPAVLRHTVFVASSQVQAYSAKTGRLLWQVPLPSYVPCSLLAYKNTVFVTGDTIVAIDAKTGHTDWEFRPDANTSLGRAVVSRGVLYFGTSSHRVYALRIHDKKQIWVADLGPGWEFPAVVRGMVLSRGVLYVTLEQWRTPNGINASGWLIALNAKNGTIKWRFSTGSEGQRRGLSSTPTVTPKFIIAADYLSNAIISLNRHTGREVWRFQGNPGFVGFPEAPLVVGNTVYAGSGDTNMYALNLDSGRVLWRRRLPGANAFYAVCGKSLLANYGGLAVLNPKSGDITHTFFNQNAEFVSSDLAVTRSRAYVAGPNGIYSFACR
jgi:outer membrane protein assembly factor BamB